MYICWAVKRMNSEKNRIQNFGEEASAADENISLQKKCAPRQAHMGEETKGRSFASGIGFQKLVWVFTIGCFIGYVVEVLFCLVTKGYFENKQGMLYGPFNQIYGFGAVLMTIILVPMSKKGNLQIFLVGALIGGIFEFSCSFIQEYVFGSRSWDFSSQMFDFNGRTSLLFMFYWGILALGFVRICYPALSGMIEKIPPKAGRVVTWLIVVFFSVNLFLSATAVLRWGKRVAGVSAKNAFQRFLDSVYPNERMLRTYPNMKMIP